MTQTTSNGAGTTTSASGLEEARSAVAGVAGSAKSKAREFADQQKNAGAEQIGRAAGAIHGAAAELEQQIPAAAEYVHQAAARLEDAAAALRERSVDDLVDSVTRFARNQPLAFFGGALLAGFAISRFLKSSGETTRDARKS